MSRFGIFTRALFFVVLAFYSSLGAVCWESITTEIAVTGTTAGLRPFADCGMSNEVFLLDLPEGRFFVKKGTPSAAAIGSDLYNEFLALRGGAKIGLAPAPIYCDREKGILIMKFLEGYTEATNLKDPAQLVPLVSLLRTLHQSPAGDMPQFDPLAVTRKQLKMACSLDPVTYQPLVNEANALLDRVEHSLAGTWSQVPCHLDVWHRNVMGQGNSMVLIDWEYAGLCDPFYELANIIPQENFSKGEAEELLALYLERKPTSQELHRLHTHVLLVNLRWLAWTALQAKLSPLDAPFDLWLAKYVAGIAEWQTVLCLGEGHDAALAVNY